MVMRIMYSSYSCEVCDGFLSSESVPKAVISQYDLNKMTPSTMMSTPLTLTQISAF